MLVHTLTYTFQYLNPITYGGGVLKTQIAFDAPFDPFGVKIQHQYFLTIPNYTYSSLKDDKKGRQKI